MLSTCETELMLSFYCTSKWERPWVVQRLLGLLIYESTRGKCRLSAHAGYTYSRHSWAVAFVSHAKILEDLFSTHSLTHSPLNHRPNDEIFFSSSPSSKKNYFSLPLWPSSTNSLSPTDISQNRGGEETARKSSQKWICERMCLSACTVCVNKRLLFTDTYTYASKEKCSEFTFTARLQGAL